MRSALLVETRRILAERGLRPKKRLGQSFLTDPRILDLIVEKAELSPQDQVVEIGAGTGILTEALAKAAGSVLALEVDRGLFKLLQERLGGLEGVTLLCEDALKVDFAAYLEHGRPAKVVANLPYSVATPLILRLLSLEKLFSFLLLMIQREVAQRLLARPGGKAYGALTIACQYHADVSLVARVPKQAFYPRPKVASALVRLDLLREPRLKLSDPDFFFRVVRAAFGKRRKTLRNALLGAAGLVQNRGMLEKALSSSGIDPRRRGETLSLEEFARLSEALSASSRTGPSPMDENDAEDLGSRR